jgi:hypothetical protein
LVKVIQKNINLSPKSSTNISSKLVRLKALSEIKQMLLEETPMTYDRFLVFMFENHFSRGIEDHDFLWQVFVMLVLASHPPAEESEVVDSETYSDEQLPLSAVRVALLGIYGVYQTELAGVVLSPPLGVTAHPLDLKNKSDFRLLCQYLARLRSNRKEHRSFLLRERIKESVLQQK